MGLSGRFRSSLVIGLQGIRARKLRTLLSMISLFLGVLAVVIVQAASVSAEKAVLQDVELTQGIDGTVLMYASVTDKSVPIVLDTLKNEPRAVASSNMQAIIGEPGVTPVNANGEPFDEIGNYGPMPAGRMQVICDNNGNCYKGLMSDPAQVAPPGQAIAVNLTAMTGDIRQFKPFRLMAGQWLDFDSAPSLSPRIVVNLEAAKGFSRYLVPAEMRFNGATANPTPRIIGVVDDGIPGPNAYVRVDELANWLPADHLGSALQSMQIMLRPDATDVQQILTSRLVAGGTPANNIGSDRINSRQSIEKSMTIFKAIFFGLASLVLLIGVAGILNVGLATVGERVEEFALRRAVGTPRMLLAGIVLAETLVTGLLTAGAAIAAAALGLKVAGRVLSGREPALSHIGFPWQAAVAGIVAGLVAGVLGGLIPAIRAARIPIATVMRA